MKRILGIDYGDARTGISITDALNITAQGLETINNKGSDKVILKRLDELFSIYEVDTIVIGRPINMNGTESERTEITDKFIHKLKCKYNTLKIETIDERLTTNTGLFSLECSGEKWKPSAEKEQISSG